MNKLLGVLFCLSCFATAYVSNKLLGAGMWFWIIVATGSFVVISQFIEKLRAAGVVFAVLLSVISVLAVIFSLLASTIGGSSGMDNTTTALIIFFTCIAVFGFALSRSHKRAAEAYAADNNDETTPE